MSGQHSSASLSSANFQSLWRSTARDMHDHSNNEKNKKEEKQNLCDSGLCRSNAAKAEHCCNDRHKQEHQGPVQHFSCSLFGDLFCLGPAATAAEGSRPTRCCQVNHETGILVPWYPRQRRRGRTQLPSPK